jgi:hypothetical protein
MRNETTFIFSEENRLQELGKVGDPLEKLQQWIDFEEFRDPLRRSVAQQIRE